MTGGRRATLTSPALREKSARAARQVRVAGFQSVLTCSSVVVALAVSSPSPAQSPRQPVKTIADARLLIGNAELPLYISQDWTQPLPGLHRAILIVHGYLRNADAYFQTALRAQHAADSSGAGTLIIAPQFLAGTDITAHHLSGQIKAGHLISARRIP
jgi:hypothetical protein